LGWDSERIPCPHPGRIWLLQEGRQAAMYWHIEARVVLDLLELPDVVSNSLKFFDYHLDAFMLCSVPTKCGT
jgi:hypothetical protein